MGVLISKVPEFVGVLTFKVSGFVEFMNNNRSQYTCIEIIELLCSPDSKWLTFYYASYVILMFINSATGTCVAVLSSNRNGN